MTEHVGVTAAKTQLTRLVSDVEAYKTEFVITRNGVPAAVLISVGELEALRKGVNGGRAKGS